MVEREFDALLVASPENIYYLSGLDHMGYFAYQGLIVPLDDTPILITRAMEKVIVQDQVGHLRHVGYSDGVPPLPEPEDRSRDIYMGTITESSRLPAGVRPFEMSVGVPTRELPMATDPIRVTVQALKEAGLGSARLGLEMRTTFLSYEIANGIMEGLPDARWSDASGLVDDCRIVQSELELACTREAARVSDAMMNAAIAAAGENVQPRHIMASLYSAMFEADGTYPGFVPLVRTTRTLGHEHGTWQDTTLLHGDLLFLEMSGCVRRYHAPLGRLVFIGDRTPGSRRALEVCTEAIEVVADTIAPGVRAKEVYAAWKKVLDKAGLDYYHRHHCGYSVGIGYPPSWSGSGVPVGLRSSSDMELRPGMVFHLMSWLLRTGRGDAFLSDTAVVTDTGCEVLTKVQRGLTVL